MATMAGEESNAPAATVLGIERWVQTAFIVGVVFLFLVFSKLVRAAWDVFAEPDPRFIAPIAGVLAAGVGLALYKAPKVHQFSHDVATELSKVTWPNREDTWRQTVVVIVVSVVAAIILGIFDAVWLGITNLVYQF
jgi:preprotein translocase subunit SecE